MNSEESNTAFIDGQNLHLGTLSEGWHVDHFKFRKYLAEKYNVKEAYYHLGFVSEDQQDLYDGLQKAGFILTFREHSSVLKGAKKGNVDTDIVFSIMKKLYEGNLVGKVVLVSGDGDYKKVVDFLLKQNSFKKILFPNQQFASSLYKPLGGQWFDYLGKKDVRAKVAYRK